MVKSTNQESVPKPQAGTVNWPVVALYIVIVAFLGTALLYSLSLGKDYANFSSSIITALTSIAGFAVGVNANPNRFP